MGAHPPSTARKPRTAPGGPSSRKLATPMSRSAPAAVQLDNRLSVAARAISPISKRGSCLPRGSVLTSTVIDIIMAELDPGKNCRASFPSFQLPPRRRCKSTTTMRPAAVCRNQGPPVISRVEIAERFVEPENGRRAAVYPSRDRPIPASASYWYIFEPTWLENKVLNPVWTFLLVWQLFQPKEQGAVGEQVSSRGTS